LIKGKTIKGLDRERGHSTLAGGRIIIRSKRIA